MEQYEDMTKDWLLCKSWYPIFGTAIVYYIFVKHLGPKLMEKREPFDLKQIIAVYNVIQIVCCTYLFYEFFQGGFNLTFFHKCHRPEDATPRLQNTIYITIILKVVELVETVFFVLRKKQNQISHLHVYHHISTVFIGVYYTKYIGGGSTCFPIALNHLVHIVMYTYYLLSSMGPNIQKRLYFFKKFITTFQMVQFVLMQFNSIFVVVNGCYNNNILFFIMFFIPDVLILFYMFSGFYRKSYQKPKKDE